MNPKSNIKIVTGMLKIKHSLKNAQAGKDRPVSLVQNVSKEKLSGAVRLRNRLASIENIRSGEDNRMIDATASLLGGRTLKHKTLRLPSLFR